MPWARDEPRSIDETVRLLRRFRGQLDLDQDIVYALFDRDERAVLGGAGLHPTDEEGVRHIGYWVHAEHIGQGLATEAAAALTKVAFELHDLRRVEITCDRENVRSAAIPRKLGYTLDATLRERVLPGTDTPRDTQLWSLLAREYPSSFSARTPVDAYDALGARILRSPG
jgi:RimJ/RimL family protein N-acetyltransferase